MRSALPLSFLASLVSAHIFDAPACVGTYTYSVTQTAWLLPDGSKSTAAPTVSKASYKPEIVPISELPVWDDKWYSGEDGEGNYNGPSVYVKNGHVVDTWKASDLNADGWYHGVQLWKCLDIPSSSASHTSKSKTYAAKTTSSQAGEYYGKPSKAASSLADGYHGAKATSSAKNGDYQGNPSKSKNGELPVPTSSLLAYTTQHGNDHPTFPTASWSNTTFTRSSFASSYSSVSTASKDSSASISSASTSSSPRASGESSSVSSNVASSSASASLASSDFSPSSLSSSDSSFSLSASITSSDSSAVPSTSSISSGSSTTSSTSSEASTSSTSSDSSVTSSASSTISSLDSSSSSIGSTVSSISSSVPPPVATTCPQTGEFYVQLNLPNFVRYGGALAVSTFGDYRYVIQQLSTDTATPATFRFDGLGICRMQTTPTLGNFRFVINVPVPFIPNPGAVYFILADDGDTAAVAGFQRIPLNCRILTPLGEASRVTCAVDGYPEVNTLGGQTAFWIGMPEAFTGQNTKNDYFLIPTV